MIRKVLILLSLFPTLVLAQINTERVMTIARNALYFEDYVLSIQYFNQVINAKPYLYEPYFFRALAKLNLEDYQGAEQDCNEAIERNPFVVNAYQIRGLSRINQGKLEDAAADYHKAISFEPENEVLWHNLALARIQQKKYDLATDALNELLKVSPQNSRAYLMKGDVALQQNDTVLALDNFNKAIKLDKFSADGWAARAIVYFQQKDYQRAEKDLTTAIHYRSERPAYYINRALARFYQNNLRGAMQDYDLALQINPYDFIGHYNRGLLRAQVGDDNRAIEDFNFVVKIDPDDMMARFNRALLLDKTGDYRKAIKDYSSVIEKYPNFLLGYRYRSEARKKIGDYSGAKHDEQYIVKQQIAQFNSANKADHQRHKGDEESGDSNTGSGDEMTRKKSNRDMNNYRKLVIADEAKNQRQYKSDYRGKIQNKNVDVKLKPMFALTYYDKRNEVQRMVYFHKLLEQLNAMDIFSDRLLLTNVEVPLTQEQVQKHFDLINKHTTLIVDEPRNANNRLSRALDFYLVQDFSNAINDLNEAIKLNPNLHVAYFMRALIRYKELQYQQAMQQETKDNLVMRRDKALVANRMIRQDLDKVIALVPDFAYAYYNRANLLVELKDYRTAIAGYNRAIAIDPSFADAYYNRGLTYIFLGEKKQGIADLSKAGELGLFSAYNIIKRFAEVSD